MERLLCVQVACTLLRRSIIKDARFGHGIYGIRPSNRPACPDSAFRLPFPRSRAHILTIPAPRVACYKPLVLEVRCIRSLPSKPLITCFALAHITSVHVSQFPAAFHCKQAAFWKMFPPINEFNFVFAGIATVAATVGYAFTRKGMGPGETT